MSTKPLTEQTRSMRPASAQVRKPNCTKNSDETYHAAVERPRMQQREMMQRNSSTRPPQAPKSDKQEPLTSLKSLRGFEPVQDTNLVVYNLNRKKMKSGAKETAREAALRRRMKLIPA